MLPIATALLLLGLAAWALGRRGFVHGLHPICAACHFDLHGLPDDRHRCPECGANILLDHAVLLGHRRPLRSAIALGLLLAGTGAACLGISGFQAFSHWDGSPYKPVRWLLADLDSPDALLRRRTCSELQSRIRHGSLAAPELQRLADKVLKLQSDRSLTWDTRWGDLLQSAHARPHAGSSLAASSWSQFLSQAMELSVRVRPRIRIDDPIPLEVTCHLRAGTDYQDMNHMEFTPEAQVSLATLKATLQSRSALLDQIPTPMSWSLLWLPGHGRGGGGWPEDLQPGPQSLQVNLTLKAQESSTSFATRKETFTVPLELLDRTHSSVTPITTAPARTKTEMTAALRWRGIGDGRGSPLLQPTGTKLWISSPPISVAFWVLIRQDGREWGIARTLVRPNDAAIVPLEFTPALEAGLQDGPAELLCRPDPDMAAATVDILEVWGEEIRRDVIVKR